MAKSHSANSRWLKFTPACQLPAANWSVSCIPINDCIEWPCCAGVQGDYPLVKNFIHEYIYFANEI